MTRLAEIEAGLRRVLAGREDVRFALLFGSVVTRGPEAARDVDVGAAFTVPPSLWELGRLETELERAIGRPVDLVDLDHSSTLLRWEVLRVGRVLCQRDAAGLVAFRARVPLEFFDLKPFLERQAQGLRRVLGVAR
ncbi:MAG TPA: nucleotidyltransferase domain-containing protein [Polyangia bacterium]|jgi:predicted nucleotidyltransferase